MSIRPITCKLIVAVVFFSYFSPSSSLAAPNSENLKKEIASNFQTEIWLGRTCLTKVPTRKWPDPTLEPDPNVESLLPPLVALIAPQVVAAFIQAGITTAGAAITRAGESQSAIPIVGRSFDFLHFGKPASPNQGGHMGLQMNPDVHCITVVHGSRDAELKNLGLRGDSRFTEQYRINPIDRAGGAADFYIRTPVLSGFRDRSDQSLADFLKVRGFRREPYFFAEFEVEFNEDLTDITQSRGARNYRLKPLEAVVVGGRNAPVGWYPVVTLSLDSPNGAASETWAFDLKPVMERYSAARLGAEGPGDRFPEVRMVMTSSPIGTPMFRKLPALGSDEAALFKRYNTLVAIDQAYELSKKKKKEADDDAKEEKEEKCKFSKLPYEPGPGKPDDDPTGSKNHRSQYYEYILRSDPSVVEVRGEIAKAKAEGKGDVVKALEAQREELIKAKWEALEIQRLVARGAAQTECDEVENVEPDEKGTAAAEGKPLTPSEKAEMERIEAIFASGVQFSEVTASVVWTKEPNQFLINLGKAVSAKAAETATALSSALLQTEAAQLQEDIEASLSDTSIETEALTAVADYLAAVEAAQLDPTNEALIVKAEAALRAASGKCEVASLSGISVSRCSLPFTPPL